MLDDGFKSEKYSAILGNLSDNGYLDQDDVDILLREYTTTQKIMLDGISREKAIIVSEALIDNYNRIKPIKNSK